MLKKLLIILLAYPYIFVDATNIDSLLRVAEKNRKASSWNQVALYYEDIGDTIQLRTYAQKAYNLAVEENDPEEKGKALFRQSTYYEYMGDVNTALEKSILALAFSRESGNMDLITEAIHNTGYYYNEKGLYDQAIEAYREAIITLPYTPEKESNIARIFVNISSSFLLKGIPDSSIHYNQKAFDAALKAKDTIVMINVTDQLGILNAKKHQYKKALPYYEETLRLSILKKDIPSVSNAYINIAILYTNWGNLDFAMDFARKAEQSAKDCGDLLTYAKMLSLAGLVFLHAEHYVEAVKAAKKSSSLSQDISFHYYNALEVLATSYCRLGKVDSSEIYLSKMETYMESGHHVKTSRFYGVKGHVLTLQGKYKEAIPFLEKSIKLRESIDKHSEKESINQYRILSEAYQKGSKDYQKALYYKQLQCNLVDSIHKKEHSDALAEFSIKYETAEKELEVTRLKLEEEKLLRTRTLIITGLVILAVLLLIAWLYVLFLRWKKKSETVEWEKKVEAKDAKYNTTIVEMEKKQLQSYLEGLEAERTRLAKEMHDHVSNGLLALGIKMESAGVPDEFIAMAHDLHSQVRDISHALMPPVFQYASLSEIIDEYIREQNKLDGPCFQFYLSPEEGWEDLPHQTALDLYRIVQEACSNALKHACAKNVTISLTRKEDQIELSVADDGRGMQSPATTGGIGMRIINERVTNQKGKVIIDSKPGKGTSIHAFITLECS